jgi:hypothetical protein
MHLHEEWYGQMPFLLIAAFVSSSRVLIQEGQGRWRCSFGLAVRDQLPLIFASGLVEHVFPAVYGKDPVLQGALPAKFVRNELSLKVRN